MEKSYDKYDLIHDLINESYEFLDNEEAEALNEDAYELISAGVVIAVVIAAFVGCAIYSSVQGKKASKSGGVAVSRNELKEALEVLNKNAEAWKTGAFSNLTKDNTLELYSNYTLNEVKYVGKSDSNFAKGYATYFNIPLGRMSLMKYARAMDMLQASGASAKRFKDFVDDTVEKFAAWIVDCWKKMSKDNKILHDYFVPTVTVQNGTLYIMAYSTCGFVNKDTISK